MRKQLLPDACCTTLIAICIPVNIAVLAIITYAIGTIVLLHLNRFRHYHCQHYHHYHHYHTHHHHSRHNHHHHHHHHHRRHLLLLPHLLPLLLVTPLTDLRLTPGVSGPPINCLKEVIESATFNPLCCPQQLRSRTAVRYAEPVIHRRGLAGQFATNHQQLPQF